MRKQYIGLALLLVTGLLIRLWAMHWPPLPYDMPFWIAWGERMWQAGPRAFYSGDIFIDYAPGYLYVLWLIAAIKQTLLPNAGVEVYHILHRLPSVLCDLLMAGLIFVILERARRTKVDGRAASVWLPMAGTAAYAFNPASIFNSAAWGQIDATFTLGIVLALALLLWGYAEVAVACYVVAFLIKPQSISLAPLISLMLLFRYSPRRWLQSGIAGLLLAFGLLFPFFSWSAFPRLFTVLQGSVGVYPYTSLFSYNLWGLYGFWEDDTVQVGLGISLRLVGILLYGTGLGYGTWLIIRQLRQSTGEAYPIFALATYFAFLPVMVLTRMHERYLYPVLPLLLIFAGLYLLAHWHNSRSVMLYVPCLLYVVVTFLHTINLYQVYVYYLNYASGGVDRSNSLFYFVEGNAKLWSALMVFVFLTVTICLPIWTRQERQPKPISGQLLDSESV